MSQGLDRDDNDRVEKPDAQSRMSLPQGRACDGGETGGILTDRPLGNDLALSEPRTLTHEREEVRYRRHGYEWSATERAVIRKTVASVRSTSKGEGRELSAEVLAL